MKKSEEKLKDIKEKSEARVLFRISMAYIYSCTIAITRGLH